MLRVRRRGEAVLLQGMQTGLGRAAATAAAAARGGAEGGGGEDSCSSSNSAHGYSEEGTQSYRQEYGAEREKATTTTVRSGAETHRQDSCVHALVDEVSRRRRSLSADAGLEKLSLRTPPHWS